MDDHRTPGQLIADLMKTRGWTNQILAIVLDVSPSQVSYLVKDKRGVDARTALMLGDVFDLPPERFLSLQQDYDLARARLVNRPDENRRRRAELFANLPVSTMLKRGWLEASSIKDVDAVERSLGRLFDSDLPLAHAAKKTHPLESATRAQEAWLRRCRMIAEDLVLGRYVPSKLSACLSELRPLLVAAEAARKVPRILAAYGIRFVIVEALPSTKMDGACFWLNDESPVVAMTTRYDRIDNFWFVLRHELEHVARRDGMSLDVDIMNADGSSDELAEQEVAANGAAADFCVPSKKMTSFVARKSPYFSDRDIVAFSRSLNVHPGLVAGQVQRQTGRFDRFRKHLAKVRSYVLPEAASDGWGDVYPLD